MEPTIHSGATGIKANEEEIGSVLHQFVGDIQSTLEAGLELQRLGIRTAVITQGVRGSVMVAEDSAWLVIPLYVKRVSSVSSSVAFWVGLLLGLSEGCQPDEALRRATAAGAANTLLMGSGLLRKMDYDTLLPQVTLQALKKGVITP